MKTHNWEEELFDAKSRHKQWIDEIINRDGDSTLEDKIEELITSLARWVELGVTTVHTLLIADHILKTNNYVEDLNDNYTKNYKQLLIFTLDNAEKNFDAAGIKKMFTVKENTYEILKDAE